MQNAYKMHKVCVRLTNPLSIFKFPLFRFLSDSYKYHHTTLVYEFRLAVLHNLHLEQLKLDLFLKQLYTTIHHIFVIVKIMEIVLELPTNKVTFYKEDVVLEILHIMLPELGYLLRIILTGLMDKQQNSRIV